MDTATRPHAMKPSVGAAPSEGAPWLGAALRFAGVAFQFGLVVLVVRLFQIESVAFLNMLVVAWVGFVIHHFLPELWRPPFFAILSIAGIVTVLGAGPGAWLVGIGLVIIGLAHLPMAFRTRLLCLLVFAGGLGACRGQWVPAAWGAGNWVAALHWSNSVWPILGSMFMFRIVIYLYDLSHKTAKFDLWWSLSYFFMLPNVCFPLFPVVDYKTFRKSTAVAPVWETYQQGVRWMVRGLLHLLVYRLIYQNLLLDVTDVDSFGSAAQLIVCTFMLYLNVSGKFHMIVGLLHMFGFHLPRTFNLWLLSSSFTDFWRRINIYWKDFMLKVFFNPALFVVKKRLGATGALAVATSYTFFVTWALHSYQVFWIRGEFPIVFQEIVFWGFLGVMILVNVLLENRYGRKRGIGGAKRTLGSECLVGLQAIAMFLVIVVAWSFWSSGSGDDAINEWLSVMAFLKSPTVYEVLVSLAALGALGIAAIVFRRIEGAGHKPARLTSQSTPAAFWRPCAVNVAVCLCVFGIGKRPHALGFVPSWADAAQRLVKNRLNERDSRNLERGYYEGLADPATFNDELAELYSERPVDWNQNPSIRPLKGSYPPYDLYPSVTVRYKRATLSTNEWGMRDREYAQAKPPGTFRIAILGSSHTVGVGVEDHETFENLVEDRLTREFRLTGFTRFEILNFSVSGYGPVSRLITLKDKVLAFEPDMVIYVGVDDVNWMSIEMSYAVSKAFPMPYPRLVEMMSEVGVESGLQEVLAEQRLMPIRESLLLWVYQQMVDVLKDRSVLATATFLPRPEEGANERPVVLRQAEIAAAAGFTVLPTAHAYDGADDVESLWVAKWDRHPNAEGHRILAGAVYEAVTKFLTDQLTGHAAGDQRGT